MMKDKRLIQTLLLENLLSYGSQGEEIELQPLNVLIGPNASGKSNLIEAIGLLQATPGDLTSPIQEGGGIADWLWKGKKTYLIARIETIVSYREGSMPLRYRLSFTMVGQRLEVVDEAIENEHPGDPNEVSPYFFYRYQQGRPVLNARIGTEQPPGIGVGRIERYLQREDLSPEQSLLCQRKDPDQYPEITYLGKQFANIGLYREWNLGRYTALTLLSKIVSYK